MSIVSSKSTLFSAFPLILEPSDFENAGKHTAFTRVYDTEPNFLDCYRLFSLFLVKSVSSTDFFQPRDHNSKWILVGGILFCIPEKPILYCCVYFFFFFLLSVGVDITEQRIYWLDMGKKESVNKNISFLNMISEEFVLRMWGNVFFSCVLCRFVLFLFPFATPYWQKSRLEKTSGMHQTWTLGKATKEVWKRTKKRRKDSAKNGKKSGLPNQILQCKGVLG